MSGVKTLLGSRTIWAVLITLVIKACEVLGYDIPFTEQHVDQLVYFGAEVVGILAAGYYRIVATKQVVLRRRNDDPDLSTHQ